MLYTHFSIFFLFWLFIFYFLCRFSTATLPKDVFQNKMGKPPPQGSKKTGKQNLTHKTLHVKSARVLAGELGFFDCIMGGRVGAPRKDWKLGNLHQFENDAFILIILNKSEVDIDSTIKPIDCNRWIKEDFKNICSRNCDIYEKSNLTNICYRNWLYAFVALIESGTVLIILILKISSKLK